MTEKDTATAADQTTEKQTPAAPVADPAVIAQQKEVAAKNILAAGHNVVAELIYAHDQHSAKPENKEIASKIAEEIDTAKSYFTSLANKIREEF